MNGRPFCNYKMYEILTLGLILFLILILVVLTQYKKKEDYNVNEETRISKGAPIGLPKNAVNGDILINDGNNWEVSTTENLIPKIGTKVNDFVEIGKLSVVDSINILGSNTKNKGISLGFGSTLTSSNKTNLSISTGGTLGEISTEIIPDSYIPLKYNGKILWIPTIRNYSGGGGGWDFSEVVLDFTEEGDNLFISGNGDTLIIIRGSTLLIYSKNTGSWIQIGTEIDLDDSMNSRPINLGLTQISHSGNKIIIISTSLDAEVTEDFSYLIIQVNPLEISFITPNQGAYVSSSISENNFAYVVKNTITNETSIYIKSLGGDPEEFVYSEPGINSRNIFLTEDGKIAESFEGNLVFSLFEKNTTWNYSDIYSIGTAGEFYVNYWSPQILIYTNASSSPKKIIVRDLNGSGVDLQTINYAGNNPNVFVSPDGNSFIYVDEGDQIVMKKTADNWATIESVIVTSTTFTEPAYPRIGGNVYVSYVSQDSSQLLE